MAMVVATEKSRKSEKRPWMLRDYLRDDVSSCSSNGFRSFPRRQCCVAVKNMIENRTRDNKPPRGFARNRCFSSAIHRASTVIINVVKLLPLKSTVEKNRLLPRSFSKKLFTRSFWLKNGGERKKLMVKEEVCDDEIERWISSGVVGSEKYQPLDLSNDTVTSSNSNTNSDGKSDSWSDITFSSSDNDVIIERKQKSPVKATKKDNVGVGVRDSDGSVTPPVAKCVRSKKGEQEHFSPISVLDFSDNNEETSLSFTYNISDSRGTKERLMKKLGRFDSILETQLEPINLESLLSVTKFNHLSPEFSIQSCQTPSYVISSECEEEEEIHDEVSSKTKDIKDDSQSNDEEKVRHLLDVTRTSNIQLTQLDTQVLRDFFQEHITVKEEHRLLKAANDWVNGHHDKLILGWEIVEKRQAYIRDMEEEGKWRKDSTTKVEESEVAIELGGEVLTHLIEEVLIDICNS